MGMKPVKNRSRAIFEEVGVETPKQMPVAPKGGMIDARPKGARKAVLLWMVSLIVLAVLQLGLDATPGFGIAELDLVQPYTGLALFAVWALGALGLAVSRRLPPGWGMRVAGLGLGCLLLAASDPAPMSQLSKALSPEPVAEVLPQTGALPPLQLLPATPPTPAPVVAPPRPRRSGWHRPPIWSWHRSNGRRRPLALPPFATLRLGLAFALAGFAFWYALLAARTEAALISARRQAEPGLVGLATGLMHLSFLQLLVGGLVTGVGAGAVFTDWPMMGGVWLPPDMLALQPIWRNALENQALLQFSHRALGYLLVALALFALIRARRSVHGVTRTAFVLATVWMVLQAVLGVVTLLHGDPLALRLAHLGGALVLWLFLIRARFLARYPRVQSIRGIK
ncbi:COX15/CtaA family protein [Rhodobacter capsulatus]|uniref:COX15/CtaA family protein n=1 Tax=Rhodobacter capsulatus TaxID=1061 RepID=UPI00402844D8